ncbi:MAG: TIGR01841 family phasin [Gammaproteobacteria bacterium]
MDTTFTTPDFLSKDAMAYWDTLSRMSMERGKELEALNLKLLDKLVKKQAKLFDSAVSAGNKVAALVSEGKQMPELIAEQSRLTAEFGSKLLAVTRETGEILVSSQEDYRNWFEQGFKTLTEQAQSAATSFNPASFFKAA